MTSRNRSHCAKENPAPLGFSCTIPARWRSRHTRMSITPYIPAMDYACMEPGVDLEGQARYAHRGEAKAPCAAE
jgi:hypothetical protein